MELSLPSNSPNRWYRVAAWTVGAVLALGALAIFSWPVLLEGSARRKVMSVLERKFDVVELGCFELGRDQLHICDIHLEKESVVVGVEDVTVDFKVLWFDQQVLINQVIVSRGSLEGEVDDIRELRRNSSIGRDEDAGPGRLLLEEAELRLDDIEVGVHHGTLEVKTTASASSEGAAGPVALELAALELLQGGNLVASASTVTSEVDLEEPFPLDISLVDAEARRGDISVEDVGGQVVLEDAMLKRATLDLHGLVADGQSWKLAGDVDRGHGTVDVTLEAEGIRPGQLPGARQLPVDPDRGTVSGYLSLTGSRKEMHFKGGARVHQLHIVHPKLARQSVVLNNVFTFEGFVDAGTKELILERGTVATSGGERWELQVSGRVLYAEIPAERELEIKLELPTASCQELLESVPPGLLPALEGFKLSGVTYANLDMFVKMDDPDATVLEGGIDLNACRLKKVPKTIASLKGPFSHIVKMTTGRTVSRLLGRGALYYTPYDRIPKSLPAAVLSTEDGGFWHHDGFLDSQFQASLRRNVQLGEFRRGASTITMQMVKNVLLTQEKTVSRKLQELFLTWVVEKTLAKQRIMEIYLNVVEFGPGIYGVGDAADHYFGKTPLELTSLESAFLATLLPRPVERHEMWCRGRLTEQHDKHIRRVHRRMLAKGRISRAEYDAAEASEVVFSRRGWPGEAKCLANGRRVAEGAYTQGALSGLLLGRPG